jgi:hypothetical protein
MGDDLGGKLVILIMTCGADEHAVITASHHNASQGPNNLTIPSLVMGRLAP